MQPIEISKSVTAILAGATMIAAALATMAAAAQEFKPDPVDEAAAKREGAVTWYTATPVAAAQHIVNEFQKQTGIKVELLRTSGQIVIRRFLQEAAAGRISADVMTMSDMSAASAMARRGMFVPFKPAAFDKVLAEVKDPNGYYVAQRLTLVGMVARTDRVASADLPKTWTDLMHPKYKGRMVMADPSFASIQLLLVATLSQKLGWQFYEGLRRNDTLVVQGNEQVYDMLKRGERVIAAEASDPRIYAGGVMPPNMTVIFPDVGSILVPSPTAVIKGSPNPNAAKLFAQFNLTYEVQQKFIEEGRHSPRMDIEPPTGLPRLDTMSFYRIDYDWIESNSRQIKARFAEIFE
jgi:iron(III) transport system substrate-binding protein